jgi:hypothetical protein
MNLNNHHLPPHVISQGKGHNCVSKDMENDQVWPLDGVERPTKTLRTTPIRWHVNNTR